MLTVYSLAEQAKKEDISGEDGEDDFEEERVGIIMSTSNPITL